MINSRDINELHPTIKRAVIELTKRMAEKGYKLGVSSTYRDIESQNAIYAQGRTTPGSIVTNAKGGDSFHNYRLAFDMFNNVQGKEYDLAFLKLAGKIGMEMGLEWGGSWQGFVDTAHFQWSDGLTLADLKNKKYPQDKKLVWEQTIVKPETDNTKDVVNNSPIENNFAENVQTKEISIMIDDKIYKVNSLVYKDFNYIQLRSFEQAGYSITFDEVNKLAKINKPV